MRHDKGMIPVAVGQILLFLFLPPVRKILKGTYKKLRQRLRDREPERSPNSARPSSGNADPTRARNSVDVPGGSDRPDPREASSSTPVNTVVRDFAYRAEEVFGSA